MTKSAHNRRANPAASAGQSLAFTKMNGLGNDFVVFGLPHGRGEPLGDNPADYMLTPEFLVWVASREHGIGCDQIILVQPSTNHEGDDASPSPAHAVMGIYNSDGSAAAACGNAARCVVGKLADDTHNRDNPFRLSVDKRIIGGWREGGGTVALGFGRPQWHWSSVPLASAGAAQHIATIARAWLPNALGDPCLLSVGNPHCVIWVDDTEGVPIDVIGPLLERNPLLPDRANVSVAAITSHQQDTAEVTALIWERGGGITQACGSAACAIAAALQRAAHYLLPATAATEQQGDVQSARLSRWRVGVTFPGGRLDVEIDTDEEIIMRGAWSEDFTGTISVSSDAAACTWQQH